MVGLSFFELGMPNICPHHTAGSSISRMSIHTIDFLLLQMRKRFLTHAAAVAVRVAAGADHKMLRHWFTGESLRKQECKKTEDFGKTE